MQSFTIAAMVALGELEPIDAAIHADTGHESQLTYEFAERWTSWLDLNGVKVVTVKADNTDPINNGYSFHSVPYFFLKNGVKGMNKRQCTTNWKIIPMRRWISCHIENKKPGTVEQWIGISLDESQRMRDSDVKYITNIYPLIEKRMTRNDCKSWLKKHNLELPNRSSCVFCPYHDTFDWQSIKNIPDDWARAVMVDNAIRYINQPPYEMFIHNSCKRIEDVDLRTPQEKGQINLWENECSGICGV